jgi:hypothetical protein
MPIVNQPSDGVLLNVVAPNFGVLGRPVFEQVISKAVHAHRIERHESSTEIGSGAPVGPPYESAGRLFRAVLRQKLHRTSPVGECARTAIIAISMPSAQ